MNTKHPFFAKVQQLAEAEGIVAYIIVGAFEGEGTISIATAAGTKMNPEVPATEKVYGAMEGAFERGMREIVRDDPPKGGLLN
jgi:hypothetical protein